MAKLDRMCIATRNSKMGFSDQVVLAGTIGFIQQDLRESKLVVYWPQIKGYQFAHHAGNDIFEFKG